ncbi:hypothetical protein ACWD4F_07490 [Streptomyces aureus]|uniref:Uncharacterized protein n=1 Tax=Streptomyces triticiradicis TaxID=2651189 RepID=A0A7J5DM73_9ACTN|nr:hypothetical protein [Streptomyces triticiradicis]KAB1989826.1 hypothetical protein F8144_05630 [Streptomyces triticiradicis]
MIGLLCALVLVGWITGIVLLAVGAAGLIASEPLLRVATQLMPAVIALYLSLVVVFWPAAATARALDLLVNGERP